MILTTPSVSSFAAENSTAEKEMIQETDTEQILESQESSEEILAENLETDEKSDEIKEAGTEETVEEAASENEIMLSSLEAEIVLESLNEKSGDFVLRIENLEDAESVTVPIWSAEDQSDMIWYDAEKDGDFWYVYGNISRHKYNLGEYFAHVYTEEKNGLNYICQTSFQAELSTGEMSALTGSQSAQGTVKLSLNGVKDYGSLSGVQIAVWSEADGQDDLVWYTGDEDSDSNYSKIISLSSHKGTGRYFVHFYGNSKAGKQIFLGSTEFEVEAATAEKITVENVNQKNGSFTVRISGLDAPSGAKSLLVPVWCSEDQSDIVWYEASKSGNDYLVNCKASAHKYHAGDYKIHAYVKNSNDQLEFLGNTETTLSYSYSKPVVTDVNGDETKFNIHMESPSAFGSKVSVQYAVWSEEGGQDDLKWYTASEKSGVCDYTVNIADHKSGGLYYVHVYVKTADGTMNFLCDTSFTVSTPTAENITFSSQKDTGSLTLQLSEIQAASGVSKITASIWCKEDKSDLKEYELGEDEGVYTVRTNVSRHSNHLGIYYAQISITDGNGIHSELGTVTADMNPEGGRISVDQSLSEVSYPVYLSGYDFCNSAKSVSFAVWSEEGGQDDLVWYEASLINGRYTANIDLTNHMTAGIYYVHAYVNLKDSSMVMAAETTFEVEKVPEENIEITDIDRQNGTFVVRVTTVRKKDQIKKITVPIWSESDQSDLVWYEAEKEMDGSYVVYVSVADFDHSFGTYYAHAYMEKTDGSSVFLAGTQADVEPQNYVILNQVSDSCVKITVYGASYKGKQASAVSFPTWSVTDGQSDLIWYSGQDEGNGTFTVSIYRSSHSNDGYFITDVYTSNGSSSAYVTRLGYEMTESQQYDSYASSVMCNILFAVETGGQIYGNATYNCFTTAYKNSAGEHAITIGAGAWYANEAKTLLSRIRSKDPETFAKLDTAGIGNDLDTQDWSVYGTDGTICSTKAEGKKHITIASGSAKAKAISAIIGSDVGIQVQKELMAEECAKYIKEAENLGVTDLKAKMFCVNIRHLGGLSAVKRVVNNCVSDGLAITMENLWSTMLKYDDQSALGNQVGSPLYQSRHIKVMSWLNIYIG